MLIDMSTIVDSYPLFTVARLEESAAFFQRHLGLQPIFQASWVVMLARPGEEIIALGLMSSDHPSRPPGPELFNGQGMLWTAQVSDATALYERLRREDAPIHHELCDCPWGQRRFMLKDPSGILIDIVEQIEPAPGFWDAYL
jgi:uncharacterized glyoxalase superfamily protein PhnB